MKTVSNPRIGRRVRPGSRFGSRLAALALAALATTTAFGQAPSPHANAGAAASVPPLPSGNGRLIVEVIRKIDGSPLPGVDLALYALSPDGQPGLGAGVTDEDGRFVFEDIASSPEITYLAGANHRDVPFGQRVTFEPGLSEQHARIEVMETSTGGTPLRILETRVRLDWLGTALFVQVSHLVQNADETVRLIHEDERGDHAAPFRAELPATFIEFAEAPTGFAEGLVRDGSSLRFYGPVYPGTQEIRYRYTLAVPAEAVGDVLEITATQPQGTGRLIVLIPASGPGLEMTGVTAEGPVEVQGETLESFRLAAVAPGDSLALRIHVPESRSDPEALALSRVDYWVDQDDTGADVHVQIQFEVSPGPQVMAAPEERLLHFDLPIGAEVSGVSNEAERMGLVLAPQGGLDLVGPVPPGPSAVDFRYRSDAVDGRIELEIRFDRPLPELNVLVADTGVIIESDRLHRRRPFHQGTRNYLHRRAFQIEADERIGVRIEALKSGGSSRNAAIAAIVVLAGGAAWFLSAPVRDRRTFTDSPADSTLQREREMIYGAIRDLDHDLDTGKIDATDHASMRSHLRGQAVDLLRAERADPGAATGSREPEINERETPDSPGFCSQCGGELNTTWRFCSHCGSEITTT